MLAALLVACGQPGDPLSRPRGTAPPLAATTVEDVFGSPQPYPLAWTRDGHPAAEINSIAGPEHCDWQSATLLHLHRDPGGRRQFIRDPNGVITAELQAGLRRHVALPPDALDTRYRTGPVELWLAASDPGGAYLKVGSDVERWPAPTGGLVACA